MRTRLNAAVDTSVTDCGFRLYIWEIQTVRLSKVARYNHVP